MALAVVEVELFFGVATRFMITSLIFGWSVSFRFMVVNVIPKKPSVKSTGVEGTMAKTMNEKNRTSWLKTVNESLLVNPCGLFLAAE